MVGPPGTEVPPPPGGWIPDPDNPDWEICYYDCGDPDNDHKDNGGSSTKSSSSSKTIIINQGASVNEVSNCRIDGSAHGTQQKFDTAKFRACGLYANGQKAYSDGFIAGCTQAGNTQQMCLAFVELNTRTQPTQPQTQTQIVTQPTKLPTQITTPQPQTQSATQPTQAIQPTAVG